MEEQQSKSRNPFDDDAKLEVDPVGALCDRIDWLRENHLMLSVGTQGVIQSMQSVERKIDEQSKREDSRVAALGGAIIANSAQLAKLSERQLWVIGMAAAPCAIVLLVGGMVMWQYVSAFLALQYANAMASLVVP